jgi:hypothetical protein
MPHIFPEGAQRAGGLSRNPDRATASRINGLLGGRPRKDGPLSRFSLKSIERRLMRCETQRQHLLNVVARIDAERRELRIDRDLAIQKAIDKRNRKEQQP